MKSRWIAIVLATCLSTPAWAAPPEPGSEDSDLLMPYAEWIAAQVTHNGGLCCSVADCRVVRYRPAGDGYEAFISLADDRGFTKFPGAPNTWLPVPDAVIKRTDNPTGQAVACWVAGKPDDGGYYCFFLPELG